MKMRVLKGKEAYPSQLDAIPGKLVCLFEEQMMEGSSAPPLSQSTPRMRQGTGRKTNRQPFRAPRTTSACDPQTEGCEEVTEVVEHQQQHQHVAPSEACSTTPGMQRGTHTQNTASASAEPRFSSARLEMEMATQLSRRALSSLFNPGFTC